MTKMIRRAVARLAADRRGVTALEYGLIATLIALAVIGGAKLAGTNANTVFNNIAAKLANPS